MYYQFFTQSIVERAILKSILEITRKHEGDINLICINRASTRRRKTYFEFVAFFYNGWKTTQWNLLMVGVLAPYKSVILPWRQHIIFFTMFANHMTNRLNLTNQIRKQLFYCSRTTGAMFICTYIQCILKKTYKN